MKFVRFGLMLAVLCSFGTGLTFGARPELKFQITDIDGQPVKLEAQSSPQLTVLCFLGTECPLARLYGPRLTDLAQKFAGKPVRFLGINSNSQDSLAEIRTYAQDCKIKFPLIRDESNRLADLFEASRTPEVFVVDETLTVRYRGRIDDQYRPGLARSEPTRDDLRLALEELLAGKPVSVAQTEAAGCVIGRVKKPTSESKVTFANQVSRILQKHCVECHRPGEIGPFSLTDFDEVVGWGDTLVEAIDAGRMPPWNASPEHGEFANARHMPDEDKQILRDWVAAGMPFGEEWQLPKPQEYASDWNLPRKPDLVVSMRDRPFQVPATGSVEYQYFVVDPKFTEDRWVSAAQVIPGARSVVHHAIVFVRPPDGTRTRGVGWLTGYVPGQRISGLPPGQARRVQAGSKLVFQMHYTPNGTAAADLTKLGINFVPEAEVTHEVYTLLAINQEFEIPPETADYPVEARVPWLPKHGELLAIIPHMHVRGQSFRAFAQQGDRREVLLDVPRYDFNWQHVYELKEPLNLKEIEGLEFTAKFDNSRNNPVNPDPSEVVTWGDQTWEEMAIAFFEVAVPRNPPADEPAAVAKVDVAVAPPDHAAEVQTEMKEFFDRFDQNKDGVVQRAETPLVFRTYGFRQFDSNRDDRITSDEIEPVFRSRIEKRARSEKRNR